MVKETAPPTAPTSIFERKTLQFLCCGCFLLICTLVMLYLCRVIDATRTPHATAVYLILLVFLISSFLYFMFPQKIEIKGTWLGFTFSILGPATLFVILFAGLWNFIFSKPVQSANFCQVYKIIYPDSSIAMKDLDADLLAPNVSSIQFLNGKEPRWRWITFSNKESVEYILIFFSSPEEEYTGTVTIDRFVKEGVVFQLNGENEIRLGLSMNGN